MHDAVLVRVRHRLGHLAEQRELVGERNLAGLVGEPQVEPLEPLVHRVDEADAEVVLDHVLGAEQPFVREAAHDAELVLGDPPHLRPLGGGGTGRGDEEPDPRLARRRDPVEGRPVLPAVPLAEEVLVDHPRAGLALAAQHDADPLHQLDDRLVTTRRERLVRCRGLKQPFGDPRQAGLIVPVVESEQVGTRGQRQLAPEPGMMQEHALLHERYFPAGIRDVVTGLLRPADAALPAACRRAAVPCAAPA